MSLAMTSKEIKVILDELSAAMLRAAANGGITSYSLNTGQTITKVDRATLSDLDFTHRKWMQRYNETTGIETGGNNNIIRDVQPYEY